MSAESPDEHDLRPHLMANADLGGDIGFSADSFEFLGEHIGDEQRRRQWKRFVDPSSKELVAMRLDLARNGRLRLGLHFGLWRAAVKCRRNRGL